MNSAYAVGATFTLENLFSPEVKKIAEDLRVLSGQVDKTKENLAGVVPAKSIAARIDEACGSFDLLGKKADAVALRMAGAMDKAAGGVTKASTAIKGELDGVFAEVPLKAATAADAIVAQLGRAASGAAAEAGTIRDAFAGAFVDLGAGLDGSVNGITAQLGRVTASAGEAAGAIASIRRELASLAAIPAMNLPTLPGGGAAPGGSARLGQRSSGGHRTAGPHFGRVGAEIPGGHASIGGGAGLAAAGMIGYGIYEAAEMRDEVNKLLLTGQVDAKDWGGKRDQLTKLLMDSASLTAFSVKEVGEALSKSERAMNGLDVNTKMDVTKALIPYAAAEAKLKNTTLAESLESMVGLAHMTGTYDPKEIADLARKFSFVSLSTNSSLPAFEKTLSYSLPILRTGMGMNPDTIMALTAAAQNSGITSTKSGTWLRSFFEGSEPETGDGDHAKNHNAALKKFGLVDDNNMPTWKVNGADGNTDWTASVAKEAELLGSHLKNLPIDERMGAVKQIWGERGGGMASMLSMGSFVDQFATLAAKIQSFKGGESALEEYAKDNPAQTARTTWRDFQNVLMDIGNTTLPTVNTALQSLDVALKAIPADWEATKKLWSDRIDGVLSLPHKAAEALGAIPGVGAPFRSDSKPGFDPNTAYEAGGFQPMAYHEGSTGGISDAEETIYRGTLRAFTDFAAGKSVSGTAGGGSGFQNASWEGGSFGFGGGGSSSAPHGAANLRYGPGGHSPASTFFGEGGSTDTGGAGATAGMRARNLGNIGYFGQHTAGLVGPSNAHDVDHSIALFATQEDGIRAAANLALKKYQGGRHSSWDLIAAAGGWTPGALGPGASVNVAKAMGLGNKDDMHLDQPGQMEKFLRGLATQEHGPAGAKFYSDAMISGALHGAKGTGELAGNDPVGLALSMQHLGIGQAGSALGRLMHDDAWCADFVNGVLAKSGGRGTENAMARSFVNWGSAVGLGDIQRNDVAVLNGGGHVGLFTGERDANGRLGVVAGNTRDGRGGHDVEHYFVNPNSVFAARRGAADIRPETGRMKSVSLPPKQPDVQHISVVSVLDGKQIAKSVVKTMGRSTRYPTSVGAPDSHGHYVHPGVPVMDSA